jgi:uncharacterized membrane protein
MNYLMLVLRLTHIFAGVLWVGATLFTSLHLKRTAAAAGDAGRQVMQRLAADRRLRSAMTAAALLTVGAGYAMYWIDSAGFTSAWTHSGPGIGFALGGGAGLLGLVTRLLADRNQTAWSRSAPGAPEWRALERRQSLLDGLNTWLLVAAVAFMATARYLVF